MRRFVPYLAALWLAGCGHPSPATVPPSDDPLTRSTTDFNPPGTPEAMAQKCDVPIYPKAQAPDDMSRMPHKDNDGNMVFELVLTTQDAPTKVAAFYSKALKLPTKSGSDAIQLLGRSPHGNEVLLQIEKEGGQTVVRIHSIGKP